MDAWSAQSLIYRDEEGTKLIGIDLMEQLNFWVYIGCFMIIGI